MTVVCLNISDSFKNEDAIENAICYAAYNKSYGEKNLYCGGYGFSDCQDINKVIADMKAITAIYTDTNGRKIRQIVVSFSDSEFITPESANEIAWKTSWWFSEKGYQIFWSIHDDIDTHTHIHFILNPINIGTGLKIASEIAFIHEWINNSLSNTLKEYNINSIEFHPKTINTKHKKFTLPYS